ncbi:MAG TPA: hypothetical protein VF092_05790 [Longimicrobium sp.]
MSDPQPTATPPAPPPSSSSTTPSTPPAQPVEKPPTLRLLEAIAEAGCRDGVWMSPTHFAVCSGEGVGLYDVSQAEPRRAPLGTSGDVTALAYIPATRTLILGDESGQVHSKEMGSGRSGFHVGLNRGAITRLAADASGRRIAAASASDVAVVDLVTNAEWHLPEQRQAVAWLGDGVFATVGREALEVWFCDTRDRVATLAANVAAARTLEYLAAPGMLSAGFGNGEVGFWAMQDDPPTQRGVIRDPGGLSGLAINPDGKTLATGSAEGVRLWNDFAAPPPATDAGGAIRALRYSADGTRLAAVTDHGLAIFAVEI